MNTQKAPPLSKVEVSLLIDLIQENNAITNKATNASNNLLKEAAWLQVANNFNSRISSFPRTVPQLKLKWENLKKAARKKSAKIKANNNKTGGGKADYIPPDEALDRVMGILGPLCHGYSVPFGGDSENLEDIPVVVFIDESTANVDNSSGMTGDEIVSSCVVQEETSTINNAQSSEVTTPKPNKFIFTSPKSVIAKQKRKMIEDDIKARTGRNIAIKEYYELKKKKEETELEAKELEKKKMQLELENLVLENKKLKLDLENLNK